MKIEVLYPEIANLYGDPENVTYLQKSNPEIEVVETHLTDVPLFVREKPALVYMGTMTERAQLLVIEALKPHLAALQERIADGTLFLMTGNAFEVFGSRIEDLDGTSTTCLGLFPTTAKRDMMHRYNSLYLGKFEEMDIVGYKSQFTQSYRMPDTAAVYPDVKAAWETTRGPGLNPDTTGEGLRVDNFIATYVIGPILVLNPPLAKWFLREMGTSDPKLAFEEAAMEAYQIRVKEYSDPDTGFYY